MAEEKRRALFLERFFRKKPAFAVDGSRYSGQSTGADQKKKGDINRKRRQLLPEVLAHFSRSVLCGKFFFQLFQENSLFFFILSLFFASVSFVADEVKQAMNEVAIELFLRIFALFLGVNQSRFGTNEHLSEDVVKTGGVPWRVKRKRDAIRRAGIFKELSVQIANSSLGYKANGDLICTNPQLLQ